MAEHDDIVFSVACEISDDDLARLRFSAISAREHLGFEDLEATCVQHVTGLVVSKDIEVLVASIQ